MMIAPEVGRYEYTNLEVSQSFQFNTIVTLLGVRLVYIPSDEAKKQQEYDCESETTSRRFHHYSFYHFPG
jgi:hypothetical protein